jgi:hypothetical protein
MSNSAAPTLQSVLYDERLSNDQRLVISKLMDSDNPIESAKISALGGGRIALFAWTLKRHALRIDTSGKIWTTA